MIAPVRCGHRGQRESQRLPETLPPGPTHSTSHEVSGGLPEPRWGAPVSVCETRVPTVGHAGRHGIATASHGQGLAKLNPRASSIAWGFASSRRSARRQTGSNSASRVPKDQARKPPSQKRLRGDSRSSQGSTHAIRSVHQWRQRTCCPAPGYGPAARERAREQWSIQAWRHPVVAAPDRPMRTPSGDPLPARTCAAIRKDSQQFQAVIQRRPITRHAQRLPIPRPSTKCATACRFARSVTTNGMVRPAPRRSIGAPPQNGEKARAPDLIQRPPPSASTSVRRCSTSSP